MRIAIIAALSVLTLAACSTGQVPPGGKISGPPGKTSIGLPAAVPPPAAIPSDITPPTASLPTGAGGSYKVGRPYVIRGVRYVPREDPGYDQTGIASWYGPKFHGRPTANGETFDMYRVSAAHNTLPMPVMVRVTNLENGKSVVLRVNDRGPFARGRIIDLSYRAARLLDFVEQGTARVRVQYVGPAGVGGDQAAPVRVQRVDVRQNRPVASELYVQAGSFSDPQNARRLRDQLTHLGPVRVVGAVVNGRDFYRVRVGPLNNVAQADRLLDQVIALGHPQARIFVDDGAH